MKNIVMRAGEEVDRATWRRSSSLSVMLDDREARTKEDENIPGAHTCTQSRVCIIVSAFGRTCMWVYVGGGLMIMAHKKQFATRLRNTEIITWQLELRILMYKTKYVNKRRFSGS